MAKFETVKTIEDIQYNVKRFIKILEENDDVPVLQRFANINYWYYFNDLDKFVPNLFLGYKNSTREFAPTPNDGHKGGKAREALENFFNPQKNDKEYDELYSKLKEFVKKYERNLNKDIRNIFEPKDEYKDKFKKDILDKTILPNGSNQENSFQVNKDRL
jgi:adenylosuccinate synthase